MIESNQTFDESAKAFEAATAKLAAANASAAAVDTRHAEATAALQAALDEQALLSAKIVKGSAVTQVAAGAAASKISDAREHLALIDGAKAIAAADVAAADEVFRHARYSHALHAIRQARRDRAAKLRRLAAAGRDFGLAVQDASEAGETLLRMQLDAQAAAKLPHQIPVNTFDQSKVATRWLCRALPGFAITAVRESMIEHWDYAAEADREDVELNSWS